MANNRQCVPVYSIHGNEIRRATVADAEYMLESGIAKRVSRLKAPLKIQLTQLERFDTNSPASISFSESLANVGLALRRGESISRSRMEAVQAKVASFAKASWADRVVTA
jgi:hypothetical protein